MACEVTLVGKTTLRRNLVNRDIFSQEKSLGTLNTAGDKVLVWRHANRSLEESREVGRTHMGNSGQFSN